MRFALNIQRLRQQLKDRPAGNQLRMVLAGAAVGAVAGMSGVALGFGISRLDHVLEVIREHWWAFVLPGIGAMLSYIFLERIMNEGAGHGVPEVIYSVSMRGGLLRLRSSLSRLVSSCLTIGSGGSAGPEAPIIITGAALGSNIAKVLRFNERERITLVGCGSAAAISSIFNAPITGIVFTLEVILGEWTTVHIVPIAVAAVTGAELYRGLFTGGILFPHEPLSAPLATTASSILFLPLLCLTSILMVRTLRKSHAAWHRFSAPPEARALIGGFMVGFVGLFLPAILGEGYGVVTAITNNEYPPGILLLLGTLIAKILATSVTLGSGGSGGVFAPCLVVGSFTGILFHRVISLALPMIDLGPEPVFAMLGMAGVVSGVLHAPLTAVFLVVELAGGYEVILPLILLSVLSSSVCRLFEHSSYYLKDLTEKGHVLRAGTDARVLADLQLDEIIRTSGVTVFAEMHLREFVEVIKESDQDYFPVLQRETDEFAGMVDLARVRAYMFAPELYDIVVVSELLNTDLRPVSPDSPLQDVLARMEATRSDTLPVVEGRRYVGMISKQDILDLYRKELIAKTNA